MKSLRLTQLLVGIVWAGLLAACQPTGVPQTDGPQTAVPEIATVDSQAGPTTTITLLNTADEHGWLQPFSPSGSKQTLGGAANLYSWWQEDEQLDDTVLILSGGDNWTGPAISTWFAGEPVVQVFNRMGYHASAIGNHEFDFGRVLMAQRFAEADYPYLAANIRDKTTGALADFAQPYAIFEVGGVSVGVLGLSTTATATTTHPKNIGDLTFAGYEETLAEYLPQLQAEGAEIIVILSHICMDELATLAATQTGAIHAMFAGHCNEFDAQMINGISVMGSGSRFASYAQLDIAYDPATGKVLEMVQTLVPVRYVTAEGNPVTPAPEIAEFVETWQTLADEQLNEKIGYTVAGLARGGPAMANLVTDAWLWAYPNVQIAMTNWGGFRAGVKAGPITWGSIIDMLPFDNNLIIVTISGAQLLENLLCCGGAVSGMTYQVQGDSVEISLADGTAFDPDATYTVIINDFMYSGGSRYLFGRQDVEGYDTNIHWRQPLIDYILSLETSEQQPLDDLLDGTARAK